MKLHETQRSLLKLLQSNILDPLTIRELQDELGVSSPSVVHHHITQLEKKGLLKRNPSNPKDYQLLDEPEKPVAYLNLYGMAQCGPNGTLLDGNPIDRIPISSKLINFSTDEAFLVQAKGDSMKPKIKSGDLIIAKKVNIAEDGDIIVCVYNEVVLIKKFYLNDGHIILHSINKSYSPILANSHQVLIQGIVKGIINYN
ncbi:S24 family peptidase [uncultured Christiangramia sp.]|uniref:LexA family protein n=1 Tax=Christiangramia sp. 3-2217-3z TaxID=3417564 RepID=UPI00262CE1F5|nr:S24 family peptidase [uncultured Christiangramia sp.]